ncbi:hypothetical protein EGW08_019752 [Elysia chlorotica]|uniref:Reverse transcriptase domain-containing protein n=1 Tax=Elysia chlorotica TaxID=188477 RepID=A0A433ST99_ELYCH|nr:hypothetical protein EGW08_019752 [Elysia chlorotica]
MAEGQPRNMFYDMNVSTFNGASPFEDFEQEVRALLRARPGLSAEQQKDLVYRHLGRDVRQELACQPSIDSGDDLLKCLAKVYGDRRPLNTLAMEFYGCKQGVYETIRHYSHRLNKAFLSLKTGHTRDNAGPVPDMLLRDQFVAGLRSESLRLHLVQHRLANADTTFLQTREFALQLSSEEIEESLPSQAAMAAQHVRVQPAQATPPPLPQATPPSDLQLVLDKLSTLTERTGHWPGCKTDGTAGWKDVLALVDTGSEVSTVCQDFLDEHRQFFSLRPKPAWFRMVAANQQTIPYSGYLVVNITVGEEVVPDSVVFVVTHSTEKCILGMNVLSRLKSVGLGPVPRPEPSPSPAPRLARTLNTPTHIPPRSTQIVTITGSDPSKSYDVLVEPLENPNHNLGLCVLRTTTTSAKGRMQVLVTNPTETDLVIPPRTSIGVVSSVVSSPVTLQLAGDTTATPDFDRLHLPRDLPKHQHEQLMELLRKHSDVFAWSDDDLGSTDLVQHRIMLHTDVPIAEPYRRIPPHHLQEVRSHIEDLVQRGIIECSTSPYAAPIVVVRKKSGGLRLCCDYRKLNAQTVRDKFSLPRIDECLDALAGANIFSTLDLSSGFHQMSVAEEDRPKTAFTCPWGHFQWRRLPFGLTNAPATCQRLMQSAMQDYLFTILLVYLDDILVYASTVEEHIARLDAVFIRLKELGIRLNPDKCRLVQQRTPFLGHILTSNGLETDPEKVEAVKNFPVPTTLRDVRSFLGLAGYYRKFVKGYSALAKPLHQLLVGHRHKNPSITKLWSEECQHAFESLKSALTSAPVLAYADFSKPFVLEVDASHKGLGAVLSQRTDDGLKVVAYASRGLRNNERRMENYSSFKLELLALKWAVCEKFRGYLWGATFTIFTDNNPLRHLHSAKLGATEQRWVVELAAYSFDVKYRPAKQNMNADALSRHPVKPADPEDPETQWAAVTCIRPATSIPELPVATNIHVVAQTVRLNDSELDIERLQNEDADLSTVRQLVEKGSQPSILEKRKLPRFYQRLLQHFSRLRIQGSLLCRWPALQLKYESV